MLALAQAPRNMQVDISYDLAPAGELIDNYQCEYWLTENGVDGSMVNCDFNAADPVVTQTIILNGTTADSFNVHLKACNVNGCAGNWSTTAVTILVSATDSITFPTGVVLSNFKF